MKKFVVVASLVAVMAAAGSSHAAVQSIVATPGGALTGTFDGPRSVAVKAAPLVFVNADPLGDHNVVSDAKANPSCTGSNCAPLFKSGPTVPAGSTQEIDLSGLAPGDYGFHCQIHPNMKGTLTIAG